MQATEYFEGLVANWLDGNAFPTVPGQLKLALSDANPEDDGTGFSEITGGSYARQNISFAAPTTNEANGAVTTNTAAINFAGLPTTTATHIAIFDSAGTNMLFYGELSAVRAVTIGDTISIGAGAISLAFKGMFSKYLGEALIGWLRGTSMPTAPTEVRAELSIADPLRDASGFTPPTGGSYEAEPIAFGTPSFTNGIGTTIANAEAIIFGPATGNWGSITHVALYHNNNNMLFYGPMAVPKTVNSGNGMGFSLGTLSLLIR
jgi:hypothetical protein